MKTKKIMACSPFTRLVVVVCVASFFCASSAWAVGPDRQQQHNRQKYPQIGQRVSKLAPGFKTLRHGKKEFMYDRGVFYRHGSGGYRVAAPPRGYIVPHLPRGFETLVIAGMTYFLFAETYYRHVPAGYVVVEKPGTVVQKVPVQSVAIAGQKIYVNTYALNVRSGPGASNSVISQVTQGTQLKVQGSAPGWYYVRLPNGASGWVMMKYTRMAELPAQG